MADDLIGTAATAGRLRVSVATLNRWATDGAERPVAPAQDIPGPAGGRPAARLYRRSDVEAAYERYIGNAIAAGACDACTTVTKQVWHNSDPCPNAEAVA